MSIATRAAVTTLLVLGCFGFVTLSSGTETDPATQTSTTTTTAEVVPTLQQLPDGQGAVDAGIAVGRAKLYDQRTLRRMLDDVRNTLAAAHYVDPAAAIAALGRIQGGTSETSWFQASVSGPPGLASQQTTTNAVTTTATSTETSPSQTSTTTQSLTTTTPAITPASYTAAPAMVGATFQPQPTAVPPGFGFSAVDVLTQQTELAYEAFNLSMLLQGAVSDRFEMSSDGQRVYRSQAVVGFQVSLNPDRAHRHAVAEVVVTIRNAGSGKDVPSLVALLPRDKTYNVATIRQGSRAVSLGAVAKLISIGVGGGRSTQSVYYVQDVDTVALEHIAPEELERKAPASVQFGWQFRPVLDQIAVSPGPRQVFAVLSLPANEKSQWQGVVNIETRWRKYDRKSRTIGKLIEPSRSYQQPYLITVPAAAMQDHAVAAQVDKVAWHYAGGDRLIVTVEGHIPSGTRVALGELLIDRPETGLILQTEQRVTFSAPIQKFAFCDAELIDPFGIATPISHHSDTGKGLRIINVRESVEGPKTTIVAELMGRDDQPLALENTAELAHHLLMIVGGRVFGLGDNQIASRTRLNLDLHRDTLPSPLEKPALAYHLFQTTTKTELWVTVPTEAYLNSPTVRVFDPLWGDQYRDAYEVAYDKSSVAGVTDVRALSADEAHVRLALTGFHLKRDGLHLRVGSQRVAPTLAETSDSLAVFEVARQNVLGVKQLVVEATETNVSRVIAIVPIPAELTWRPRVLKVDSVTQGGPPRIKLQGAHFENVVAVRWNGQDLPYVVDSLDSANLYVTLSEALMKMDGTTSLDLLALSGEVETCPLTISKPPK